MLQRLRLGGGFTPCNTILIILLCLTSVKNEDSFYDDLDDTVLYDNLTNNVKAVEDPSPILLATMLFLFAAIVSFVGVVIGYFSLKEDGLLQTYQKNGVRIEADVISFDYVRASVGSKDDENMEFKVLVEYTVCLQGNYLARVQKQMKSLSSDFKLKSPQHIQIRKCTSMESEKVLTVEFSFPDELKQAIGVENEEYFLKTLSTAPNNDKKIQHNQYTLDIIVIPNLPKSGYPSKQILRHSTCSYKSHTYFLILFLFSISSLCVFVALLTMIDAQVLPDNVSYIKWSIIGMALTVLLELLLIYLCFDHMFSYVLDEEYFYNGEFAASYCDETSLSSGSDMLLSDSMPGWAKEFVDLSP